MMRPNENPGAGGTGASEINSLGSGCVSEDTTQPTKHQAFDYTALDPAVADLARFTAAKFKASQSRMVREIIEIGTDLLWVKDRLDHGQFCAWLAAEFERTERTARNYMTAAERFGTKSETVSVLPPRTIYLLSAKSTPTTIVDAVVNKLESGQRIDPKEIKAEISEARWRASHLRKEEERRQARANNKARRARAEKEEAKRQAEEQQRRDAAKAEAEALIAEFGADTVRRIISATDNWIVREACRDALS